MVAVSERHAFPTLGDMRVDQIQRGDVLAVLEPIWGVRQETARRVRQRIRIVLRWCRGARVLHWQRSREALDGALPAMPKVKAHLRALPYQDVSAALSTVEASGASMASKLSLRFLVLTAARSGEARGATWDEIDMDAGEWRIPGERMKSGDPHRVPLSDAAVEVLERARPLSGGEGLIFPSSVKPGRPMSDMTLTQVLRKTGLAERATVHGFRSAFRDWAAECTSAPHAVMELSLAHAVGSSVEQAYARSDLIEKRRALMQTWADFLTCSGADVVRLMADVEALKRRIRAHPAFGGGPADEGYWLDFLEFTLAKFESYEFMVDCLADSCERQPKRWPPTLLRQSTTGSPGMPCTRSCRDFEPMERTCRLPCAIGVWTSRRESAKDQSKAAKLNGGIARGISP